MVIIILFDNIMSNKRKIVDVSNVTTSSSKQNKTSSTSTSKNSQTKKNANNPPQGAKITFNSQAALQTAAKISSNSQAVAKIPSNPQGAKIPSNPLEAKGPLTESQLRNSIPEMPHFLYEDVDKKFKMKTYADQFTNPEKQKQLTPETNRKLEARKVIAESLALPDKPDLYLLRYEEALRGVIDPYTFIQLPTQGHVTKYPEILSMTVISLCHGKINANVEIPIKENDRNDVRKINSPKITENPNNKYSVNYDKKFKFKYKTIPYCGVFSNVGSCPGLLTIKAPGSFMTKQNVVNYEVELMMCDGSSSVVVPEVCNPYMLYSTLKSEKLPMYLSEHTPSENVKKKRLLLTMHSDFRCQSLLDKTYTTAVNEITTRSGNITRGDAGKFILLTKFKDPTGVIRIVKTVILGDPQWRNQITLLENLTKCKIPDDIKHLVTTHRDTTGKKVAFSTTTEKIIKLIDFFIKARGIQDIPIRFFDNSCNLINDIEYKKADTDKNILLMMFKMNEYFSTIQKTGSGVFGGNSITKKRRLRHNKTKKGKKITD